MQDTPQDTRDDNGRTPFDDLRELIAGVPPGEVAMAEALREKLAGFPGPAPALGGLGDRLEWLATWQKRPEPQVARPLVAVFAGTHGVAGPAATRVAQERVVGLTQGAAAVRGIAAGLGAAFKVYEFGLEAPSADIRQGPSLSPRETAAAFAFGMEVVAEGADIIALGALGAGSVTGAAAIVRSLYGGTAQYWAQGSKEGSKEGEGAVGRQRIADVEAATRANSGALGDPLSVLSAFGGRDIAGFAGAIVAARYQAIPVVLDGFVTCAAAAVLHAVNPDSIAHCMAGQCSAEFAQAGILDRLGLEPLHDFGIGPGDGTGAALALSTLRSACDGLSTL